MTKQEIKEVLTNTLDTVESGCVSLDLDEKKKLDLETGIAYFREVIKDKQADDKDFLLMIAWAFNIGCVYGVLSHPTVVIVTDISNMTRDTEAEDEQVH